MGIRDWFRSTKSNDDKKKKPQELQSTSKPALKPTPRIPLTDSIKGKPPPRSREDQREQNRRLFDALKELDLNGIKSAIENGADLNIRNEVGWTPLVVAVNEGLRGIVDYMVSKGADPKERFGGGWTLLMFAAYYSRINVAELLLSYGIQINAQSNFGETALMLAAGKGHKEMVRFLLKNGADTTLKDNQGRTALMYAEARGHFALAKILRTEGIKK